MKNRTTTVSGVPVMKHVINAIVMGLVPIIPAMTGCTAKSERYVVDCWGSMQEALREGRTEGHVGLTRFDGANGMIAVGALEGLSGEVLVVDGDIWQSRVDEHGAAITTQGATSDDRATMLTAARIDRWREIPIDKDVSASSAEKFLVQAARDAGFDLQHPVPFMVSGTMLNLELHVVAGACPMATSHGRTDTKLRPPFQKSWVRSSAKLAGFLAERHEGTLTHHGSRMHAHVLVDQTPPVMGHIDSVGFAAGSILYFPNR